MGAPVDRSFVALSSRTMKKQTIMGKHSKRISCGARASDNVTINVSASHAVKPGLALRQHLRDRLGGASFRRVFFASKTTSVACQQGQNNLPEQRRGAWGSADSSLDS